MEQRSSPDHSPGAALSRTELALVLLAAGALPFAALTIALFDDFLAHYKRYPVYLALKLAVAAGLYFHFKRGCRKPAPPRGRRGAALFTLLYCCGGYALLLALARLFNPFVVFFEAGWLLLFYPPLLHRQRPSRAAAGLSLSAAAAVSLLFAAEIALLFVDQTPPRKNLPDYGELYSEDFHPGGQLQPGMNVRAWGYGGPVAWITNSAGFRNAVEFEKQKPARTFRVIYTGDSFVAGYRTDQSKTSGAVLERRLAEKFAADDAGRDVEVLVACTEEQASALYWLNHSGFDYQPDLVIAGVCLGNDVSQCHIFLQPQSLFDSRVTSNGLQLIRRSEPPVVGFYSPPYIELCLPADAFRNQNTLYVRLVHPLLSAWGKSHIGWRAVNLSWLFVNPGIHSMYNDERNRVHLFDNGHGLGFYHQPALEPIARAFEEWERVLLELRRACAARGARFGVVLIPQRFAVDDDDWNAVVQRFELAAEKFDRDLPARRIREFCARNRIAALDLSPAFRTAGGRGIRKLFLPLGDMHWNDAGHRVAGEAIADWIERHFFEINESDESDQ